MVYSCLLFTPDSCGSLVMRGEHVPDGTSWVGNPIGPWTDATAPA